LEKFFSKVELVEWLKVKALSANPSTTHTKKVLISSFLKNELLDLPAYLFQ
jgi:hypothetical protein